MTTPSPGWCLGVITEANGDKRFEIDDNKSKHVLTLAKYGGDGTDSWVLLEALE